VILVKASATIEGGVFGEAALLAIEAAARTCYKSEPNGPAADFVRRVLGRQHESVIEHVGFSVRFVVDRGVSHELVRHRLASFSQESTRYVDYTKKGDGHCRFVIPSWCTDEIGPGEPKALHTVAPVAREWMLAVAAAERAYRTLREAGWTAQQARSVLPNSTKTEVVMTANYREWRHILHLRTSKAAHPDMQAVMRPLLLHVKTLTPVLFDDIEEKTP